MSTQDKSIADIVAAISKDLPQDPNSRLMAWQEISELLKKVKAIESSLRAELVASFFPSPKEGTNTVNLGHGWKTKMQHTVTRKCDEATFDAVFAELPRGFKQKLINFKPELKISEYRKLTPEQRNIFDQCLIVKPGSPSLTLLPPKEQ